MASDEWWTANIVSHTSAIARIPSSKISAATTKSTITDFQYEKKKLFEILLFVCVFNVALPATSNEASENFSKICVWFHAVCLALASSFSSSMAFFFVATPAAIGRYQQNSCKQWPMCWVETMLISTFTKPTEKKQNNNERARFVFKSVDYTILLGITSNVCAIVRVLLFDAF